VKGGQRIIESRHADGKASLSLRRPPKKRRGGIRARPALLPDRNACREEGDAKSRVDERRWGRGREPDVVSRKRESPSTLPPVLSMRMRTAEMRERGGESASLDWHVGHRGKETIPYTSPLKKDDKGAHRYPASIGGEVHKGGRRSQGSAKGKQILFFQAKGRKVLFFSTPPPPKGEEAGKKLKEARRRFPSESVVTA